MVKKKCREFKLTILKKNIYIVSDTITKKKKIDFKNI